MCIRDRYNYETSHLIVYVVKLLVLALDTMSYEILQSNYLMKCHKNVKIEPVLTPLSGETFPHASKVTTNEARVDVAARGVWVKGQMALFDVRVFNPIVKVYLTLDLPAAYRRNELEKKRVYGRRYRMVDQASFTPLIFSYLGMKMNGKGKLGFL